jgi:hypothetical protein
MRNIGLFAFGVTSLLIVPAALHRLTAGPKQVARLVAPGAGSLELGGAKIDVSVDRSVVDPGDKVKITLVASADRAHKVTVGVLVLESMGTYHGRVPEPPIGIEHETLTLEATAGGGAARELAVRLPGDRKRGQMAFGRYQILVTSPEAADRLDRLRVRARREGAVPGWDPMESASPNHDKYMEAFYALKHGDEGGDARKRNDSDGDAADAAAPGKLALLEVNTRPKDSSIAIHAPDQVAVAEPFTVVVTVTNPTRRRVKDLSVKLVEPPDLSGDYLGIANATDVAIEAPSEPLELGPHETKAASFRVTARRTGVLGLYAETQCGDECAYDVRLSDGALEAIDVGAPAMAKR